MKTIKELLAERILIMDGAMGTMVQSYDLDESDFRGARSRNHSSVLLGNNDILYLTKPNIVADIHQAYL